MTGYPKWFSKNLITVIFLALVITGVFLIPNMLSHRFEVENRYNLQGVFRIILTSLHMLFSYLIILVLGSLVFIHIKSGLNKKKNRTSGFLTVGSICILIFSGLMLLYAGSDLIIKISSLIHVIVGFLIFGVYFIHLKITKPKL